MKLKYNITIAFATTAVLALTAAAQSVPSLINYQGRLTDQAGAPYGAGSYGIQFRLWDSATAIATNDLIWGQQQTVNIQSNGLFSVILGTGSPIPGTAPAVNDLTYAFAASNCFLGVTVVSSNGIPISSPTEILPRQQLLSVPFAFQAQQAQFAQQAQLAQQAQIASALVTNQANVLCPPGSIMAYMGTSAPPGWLLCDGSAVSRSQYATLFGVVGASSGAGDGTATFNLPDLRGMFLRGVNGSRSNTNYWDPDTALRTNVFAGGNVGNAVGSVQKDDFKSHQHNYRQYVDSGNTRSGSSAGSTVTSLTSATGGNETRPKNMYVNYIIKY